MSKIPTDYIVARLIAESNADNLDTLVKAMIEATKKYLCTLNPKIEKIPPVTIEFTSNITTAGAYSPDHNKILLDRNYFEKLFSLYKSSDQLRKDLATLLMLGTVVHEYVHHLSKYIPFMYKRVETAPEKFEKYFTGINVDSKRILLYLVGYYKSD